MSEKIVLALAGSLRSGSFNQSLLRAAARLAPSGMRVVVYDELALIPLFNEDQEHSLASPHAEALGRLREMVRSADALLLATPEYNRSMSGVMKNLIDWLSRPAPAATLDAKPVAFMGATSGRWGTRLAQAALQQSLQACGALIAPTGGLFVANAERLFDEAGNLTDVETQEALKSTLDGLVQWIREIG